MSGEIYVVWFKSHRSRSEDPHEIAGIFTTRTLALQCAREKASHKNDEWIISEHFLNRDGGYQTIWDEKADSKFSGYRNFYLLFWPGGFPEKVE